MAIPCNSRYAYEVETVPMLNVFGMSIIAQSCARLWSVTVSVSVSGGWFAEANLDI